MTIRKGFTSILLLTLLSFVLLACDGEKKLVGSGNSISETREISGVDSVKLEGLGELIITMGNEESLIIEGDDNIVEKITSEVKGGTLVISQERKTFGFRIKSDLIFHVTLTQLDKVTVDGAGSVMLNDLNSAIELELNGAGGIEANGTVDSQKITINGVGNYDAKELISKQAELTIDGAGSARVHATQSLDVQINGAGSVTYSGEPEVTQEINGVGSVKVAKGK